MSQTHPIQVGNIKKGSHVIIQGFPCKVIDFACSKPGKHGSSKMHLTASDIFTGRKYEAIHPTDLTIYAPFVTKKEYEFIDFNEEDGYLNLMNDEGQEKTDLQIKDKNLLKKFKAAMEGGDAKTFTVYTISAMGFEHVYDIKEN